MFEHDGRFVHRHACGLSRRGDIHSSPFSCLANIAKEVAEKVFCEATVGSRDDKLSEIIRQLIDTPAFRLRVYPDVEIIEMLGALKNVVAMLAGFAEGLKAGFNTRAAVEFDQDRRATSITRTFYSGPALGLPGDDQFLSVVQTRINAGHLLGIVRHCRFGRLIVGRKKLQRG